MSFPLALFGQPFHVVRDSLTQQPIPYANILVENQQAGTTANEKGEFSFLKTIGGKVVVLSSIGYKSKRIIFYDTISVITLQPIVTELKEIIIMAGKKSKKRHLEKFEKSDIKTQFGNNQYPWSLAHYFPFDSTLHNTPFLESISIYTISKVPAAKFIIKLHTKDEGGSIGELLHHENIIATAKKGKHITQVNVSNLGIVIPETGLFIVLEFLMIEANKHEFRYTKEGSKEIFKSIQYNPSIGGLLVDQETKTNSWFYTDRIQWYKFSNAGVDADKIYQGKFLKIAISITLTD